MPTTDPRTHITTLTLEGRRAIDSMRMLGLQPGEEAERIQQGAMLAAANVPDAAVMLLCKMSARGKITHADIADLRTLFPCDTGSGSSPCTGCPDCRAISDPGPLD